MKPAVGEGFTMRGWVHSAGVFVALTPALI